MMTISPSLTDLHGTADQINPMVRKVIDLHCQLPVARLLPGEAQRLGGWLIPHGAEVIHQVASAMSRYPDLYPDLRETIDPDQLVAAQQSINAWVRLRDGLSMLLTAVAGTALKMQALLTQQALGALQKVQRSDEMPQHGTVPHFVLFRVCPLVRAFTIVQGHYDRINERKRQRRAAKAATQAEKPQLTERQKRARERASADRRRAAQIEIREAFEERIRQEVAKNQAAEAARAAEAAWAAEAAGTAEAARAAEAASAAEAAQTAEAPRAPSEAAHDANAPLTHTMAAPPTAPLTQPVSASPTAPLTQAAFAAAPPSSGPPLPTSPGAALTSPSPAAPTAPYSTAPPSTSAAHSPRPIAPGSGPVGYRPPPPGVSWEYWNRDRTWRQRARRQRAASRTYVGCLIEGLPKPGNN